MTTLEITLMAIIAYLLLGLIAIDVLQHAEKKQVDITAGVLLWVPVLIGALIYAIAVVIRKEKSR